MATGKGEKHREKLPKGPKGDQKGAWGATKEAKGRPKDPKGHQKGNMASGKGQSRAGALVKQQ